jgi:radical SAM superfamily enzyme YgiQ (UPF0313 family)
VPAPSIVGGIREYYTKPGLEFHLETDVAEVHDMPDSAAQELPVLPNSGPNDTVVSFQPLGSDPAVLLIWPKFPKSYWGLEGIAEILPEKAHMPPLALVTIAALFPRRWRIRLIDCAVDELCDQDILQADLVVLSAMHAQRFAVHDVLSRCRRLGRRTIIGGPYASSQPEELVSLADHVVVGEVDEVFAQIASDLEAGRARRLYHIHEKPDVTRTPVPRFDLLQLNKYIAMAVQFSRGCPFQCEFCDIITIYGRRPRTKTPAQVLAELDLLYSLGWRNWVFMVDDNFIGNHKAALELARALAGWQKQKKYPFPFYTEASIDLSQRRELIDAMAEANFLVVFIGIETPSGASLREVKKYQNLRQDTLQQIRIIQDGGLWVTAGFIVGFDSDDEGIFGRQVEFIESAAVTLATVSLLQAPPTTPLHERMRALGRLLDNDTSMSYACSLPNFQTVMASDTLFGGTAGMLLELYEPDKYFQRGLRSLEHWVPNAAQRGPRVPLFYGLRGILRSFWVQGVRSDYRRAYWRFVLQMASRWWRDSTRLIVAMNIMVTAHHFIGYAREVAAKLQEARGDAKKRSAAGAAPRPA